MSESCGGFGHAWNWTSGPWGFLWLKKGGHFWCYHCGLKRSQEEMDRAYGQAALPPEPTP